MKSRFSKKLLDELRFVGDPWLEDDATRKSIKNSLIEQGRARNPPEDEDLEDHDRVLKQNSARQFFDVETGRLSTKEFTEPWTEADEPPPEDLAAEETHPYWRTGYDWDTYLEREDVDRAQNLFAKFGSEIGATLLLASLVHSYAGETGAVVLSQANGLHSQMRRRIGATAQFLLDVMLNEAPPKFNASSPEISRYKTVRFPVDPRFTLLPGGRAYIAARQTRLIHAFIRESLKGKRHDEEQEIGGLPLGKPINLEHLLGTYLSFCVTVWESLERLGIRWSQEEKEAYFHVWDWIAHLMGIGHLEEVEADMKSRKTRQTVEEKKEAENNGIEEETQDERDDYVASLLDPFRERGVVRPESFEEAQELMMMIRDRNWPAPEEQGAFQNAAGKRLVRELLIELENAMPSLMQPVPAAVMRYLADERVTVALGLGGGGLPPVFADWVQGQVRGWNMSKANPMVAPLMRVAANQVSMHSFVFFMNDEDSPLRFAGLDQRAHHLHRRSKRQADIDDQRRVEHRHG